MSVDNSLLMPYLNLALVSSLSVFNIHFLYFAEARFKGEFKYSLALRKLTQIFRIFNLLLYFLIVSELPYNKMHFSDSYIRGFEKSWIS